MMNRMKIVFGLVAVLGFGCGVGESGEGPLFDRAPDPDAGTTIGSDAGSPPDAPIGRSDAEEDAGALGPSSDASAKEASADDAGTVPDSSSPPDSPVTVGPADAGGPDATPDAEVSPPPDAGACVPLTYDQACTDEVCEPPNNVGVSDGCGGFVLCYKAPTCAEEHAACGYLIPACPTNSSGAETYCGACGAGQECHCGACVEADASFASTC